jgi:broad specificity phosphatase PhoE
MTMRLHLLCVASTPSIRSASFPSNDPLDAQGRKALEAFAGSLPPFDKTWTSPDVSALQTAEILGLCSETDPMLRDCDFGRWSGRSLVDVQTTEPDALATWLGDPTSAPHGGESFVGVVKRVQSWMDSLLCTSGSALVITHPTIIRAAIASALGAGPHALRHIDIAPLSRAKLSSDGRRWTVSALIPPKEVK